MPKTIKVAFIKTDVLNAAQIEAFALADILIILAKDFNRINVKDELSGASEGLCRLGKLTAKVKGLCFIGLITDNFGLSRKSVAVFEKGRLIKLAEQCKCEDKTYSPSCGYKTVSFDGIKIGVAVGKDLVDTSCLSCFSLCDCDVIINLSGDFYDYSTENLVSVLSYLYGVAVVSVNADKSAAAVCGKTVFSTVECRKQANITLRKTYREIIVKQRGT